MVYRNAWVISIPVAVLLLVLRAPQTFTMPQFWAEDGAVFFAEQLIFGPQALFRSHAGSFHLVPRLAAFIASPFPAGAAPSIFAALAVLITCWTAATISMARMPYAPLLGCLLLLAPHDAIVFGSMTHAQWMLAPGIAIIAVTPTPERRASRINQVIFIVAAGLTGPLAVLSAPLFLYRLYRYRDPHSQVLAGVALCCALAQVVTTVREYVAYEGERRPVHMALSMLDRWFGVLANGRRSGDALQVIGAIAMAAASASALLLARHRWAVAGLLVFACAMLAGGWIRFMPGLSHYFDIAPEGDRYFFVPRLVCLWALALIVLDGKTVHRVIAGAPLALIALHFYGWHRYPFAYLPWREHAFRIDRGEAVDIDIPRGRGSSSLAPCLRAARFPSRSSKLLAPEPFQSNADAPSRSGAWSDRGSHIVALGVALAIGPMFDYSLRVFTLFGTALVLASGAPYARRGSAEQSGLGCKNSHRPRPNSKMPVHAIRLMQSHAPAAGANCRAWSCRNPGRSYDEFHPPRDARH